MAHHLDNHQILSYLQRDQPAATREPIVEHLRVCETCRQRVEAESAFDQFIRHRSAYHAAPDGLLDRVRASLRTEERRQRRPRRQPGAWLSSSAASLAAGLALMLVLLPAQPGALFYEGLVTAGAGTGAFRNVRGSLICVGCAHRHLGIEAQRRCHRSEAEGHVTGLLAEDGRIWRFVRSSEATTLLRDPQRRGEQVEISARPLDHIDYLRVYAVESL